MTPSTIPTTMRAIVAHHYGGPEVLALAEVDRPVIGPEEVLVEVRAAGVDRGDWHLMTGLPYAVRLAGYGLRSPKTAIPGSDLAGVVVAVGGEITQFHAGDEVMGIGTGSFAELAVARENRLVAKPADLTFEQAAAVPSSGVTAWQGLHDSGRVQAGQRVLIIGASGGVGSFAVQIAKAAGAEVTGVASTAKLDLVRSLGADHVIDYTSEDALNGVQRYDLILDIGGNAPLSRLRRALSADATLVIVGGEDGGRWIGGTDRQLRALVLSRFIGPRLTTFIAKNGAGDLGHLGQLIAAGTLTPVIDRSFPLDQVPDAMRYLEAGQARGKVVIAI